MATLPQLLNTRQQIARKLAAIDDEARSLRDNLSAIDHELSARFEQLATALGLEVNETPAGPLTTAAGFTRKVAGVEIDEWIRQVLLEHGPMRPKQIWEAITAKGVEVSGRDPVNNVSARLSNSDQFYKLETGLGWWIKNEPVPMDKVQDFL